MRVREAKFKEGQIVLYKNGDTYELGVVKRIVPQEYDRYVIGSEPRQTYKDFKYSYFVWYHTGDTAALTDEFNLYELRNAYAFLMLRRKADTSSINETDARKLAAEIIDSLPQLTELEGDLYYECEDALTELLNEYKNN
ncbi:MAG: hypothetical protein PHF05_00135 [Candidatus Izemoplasmatales bacterium]|nr:hypothetical protein [Candidatus Izemoplasmatales bacterium]